MVSYAFYIDIRAFFLMKLSRTILDFTAHACLGCNFSTFFFKILLEPELNMSLTEFLYDKYILKQ